MEELFNSLYFKFVFIIVQNIKLKKIDQFRQKAE